MSGYISLLHIADSFANRASSSGCEAGNAFFVATDDGCQYKSLPCVPNRIIANAIHAVYCKLTNRTPNHTSTSTRTHNIICAVRKALIHGEIRDKHYTHQVWTPRHWPNFRSRVPITGQVKVPEGLCPDPAPDIPHLGILVPLLHPCTTSTTFPLYFQRVIVHFGNPANNGPVPFVTVPPLGKHARAPF